MVVKSIRRVSPSRYSAMLECILREAWIAADNEPLLPSSPQTVIGSVIHRLFEAAGRGRLGNGAKDEVDRAWLDLVSQAEKRMILSTLSRHQVPLSRNVPDFQVRKIRACRRASELAHDAIRTHTNRPWQSLQPASFEVWVESDNGQVGGYIDRVMFTKDGIILRDYKTGAFLDSRKEDGGGALKRKYKVQLEIYAALYHQKIGIWPIRLEVVPLQGAPVDVAFNPESAECLLAEASAFLRSVNRSISEVEKGKSEVTTLASPHCMHCGFCLFRPSCQAYWMAREQSSEKKWPYDVRGFLRDMAQLRNGKICIRIAVAASIACPIITVRNLTACTDRHPVLDSIVIGERVAIYGLHYDRRSGDYTETQNTYIYGAN